MQRNKGNALTVLVVVVEEQCNERAANKPALALRSDEYIRKCKGEASQIDRNVHGLKRNASTCRREAERLSTQRT